MDISVQDREAKVLDLIELIENVVLEKTGECVFRSGWDGTLTNDGARIAQLLDSALEGGAA